MIKKSILRMIEVAGYSVIKKDRQKEINYQDIKDPYFWEVCDLCKPFTMTSLERMFSLYTSVNYVLEKNIPGDFVECGVWRGGSTMMIAKILKDKKREDRKIYLYDTFEGMTKPDEMDVDISGDKASRIYDEIANDWCFADLEDVTQNMSLTGIDSSQLIFVKGMVEDTIPDTIPSNSIALLRLDTDWYQSTLHEMNHLFPLLAENGILILDDYGHWEGSRKAVDEYFSKHQIQMLLHRIDYSGRIGIKLSS